MTTELTLIAAMDELNMTVITALEQLDAIEQTLQTIPRTPQEAVQRARFAHCLEVLKEELNRAADAADNAVVSVQNVEAR